MADRPAQLDQISEAIGRLKGQIDGIEKYIHEKRHDDANVAQKVEALGTRITRDIAAVEGRIEGRIKAMDDRLVALERKTQREDGAKNLLVLVLQSPLLGWLALAAAFAVATVKGWIKP